MKKRMIFSVILFIALINLSACNKLDVIKDASIKSFDKVLATASDKVVQEKAFGGWSITSPDGEAKFLFSKDFSETKPYDAELEVNAKPFLDAGLDVNKLPKGMVIGDKLVVGKDFGNDQLTYEGKATPLEAFKNIVNLYRDNLKYHAALDHFGLDLDNGNAFEFAKDMSKNDKDIVYVLNPQVLIDAGVNPEKVQGWIFAKVNTMDDNGRKIQVDKFLKPFDLDGKH